MKIERKRVGPKASEDVTANKGNRAGDNDDGVNADQLMGTDKSDYSSEGDDSMLSDDVE